MARIYNFNPGPATLPTEVLEQIRDELLDWHNSGMSVMEMSHRGQLFPKVVVQESEADLRELLSIPDEYKILFLQGGGRLQFAMVPMNLLGHQQTADYINIGIWSKAAIDEAQRYCQVNVVADAKSSGYTTIPPISSWRLNKNAAYFHYVDNETVNGVEFNEIPNVSVPLVSDMSSNILSRPIHISRFGLIYAGTQKNMGIAGLAVVIVREDLMGSPQSYTPSIFNYKTQAAHHSLYNTPPTFAWYVTGLILKWLKRQGGVEKIAQINQRKADKLYQYIDESGFYRNNVDQQYRSRMNVVFTLNNETLNQSFLDESLQAGLAGLKGHSVVGGMRASIYNAMPLQGVDALIDFMKDFVKRHG